MSEKKKVATDTKENAEVKEINLEDLSAATGGSITNVKYTETDPISEDTKEKI